MINRKDLYKQKVLSALNTNNSQSVQIGTVLTEYTVQRYIDVSNLGNQISYLVTFCQRLTIPNNTAYTPLSSPVSFNNYPAMVVNTVSLQDSLSSSFHLVDYTPKTLNSSVSTNIATNDGVSTTSGEQYASGNSTAQSNNYETSANLGFFGESPTGGISHSIGGQTTHSADASASRNLSKVHDQQNSESSSMSIKDWGSYAQLSVDRETPTWIWTQEYPWDILKYQSPQPSQEAIIADDYTVHLPDFIVVRLTDGTGVFPPSELSLFGLDFVSKAVWLITPQPNIIPNQTVISTNTTYVTASHSLSSKSKPTQPRITATLAQQVMGSIVSPKLDLPLLALDPVNVSSLASEAVVGFVANQFDVDISVDTFQIISGNNDLLVRGGGFQSIMTADFSKTVRMDVYFKLVDETNDVSLFLKHWSIGEGGCVITIVVNNENTITRHVDNQEGEGGSVNISTISLRFRDFTSVNYCDYLQMGLNHLQITVTPQSTSDNTKYNIHALAIG